MSEVADGSRKEASIGGISSQHGRLVHRSVADLRPHPIYMELCGPIAATKTTQLSRQAGPIREPLSVNKDGTILDGHVRWKVAAAEHLESVRCIEYELTEEQALEFMLARHQRSAGLNAFCRIAAALHLESYYRASDPRDRQPHSNDAESHSSNLTKNDRKDVRAEIARVAGVSSGNVTKVKQITETAIHDVQGALRRGEVTIHKAWQWRKLSAKDQREALWQHQNRRDIGQTIRGLVARHSNGENDVPGSDRVRALLKDSLSFETAVAVVDLPGNAIVLTRECCQELARRAARVQHGREAA